MHAPRPRPAPTFRHRAQPTPSVGNGAAPRAGRPTRGCGRRPGRSAVTPRLGLGLLLALGTACAAGPKARTYAHPALEALPLTGLSVVLGRKAPVDAPGPLTALPLYAPPGDLTRLAPCGDCDALQEAARARLQALGYKQLRFIPAAGQTVAQARAQAGGQALLILRALPVKRLVVWQDSGQRIRDDLDDDRLGARLVTTLTPRGLHGELLLGQAFLLFSDTGARLWSRQLPDLPSSGRVAPGDPVLSYGRLYPEATPLPPGLPTAAAQAFVGRMLADFPPAHAGRPEAAAALRAVDAAAEAQTQRFLDRSHLVLSLEAGWGLQSLSSELELDGRRLQGRQGSGQLSRVGHLQSMLRAGAVLPGGLQLSLGLGLGRAPIDFGRLLYADNPSPSLADPHQRGRNVRVDGAWLYKSELRAGPLLWLGTSWALAPEGGLFAELWTLGGEGLPEPTRLRMGGLAALAAYRRLAAPLFLRAEVGGQLGWDVQGGRALAGLNLSLGLALILP